MADNPPARAKRTDPVRAARLRRGKQIKQRAHERAHEDLLSDFRGVPTRATPAVLNRATALGETIRHLMQSLKSPTPRIEQLLDKQWETIIGDKKLAAHASIQRLAEDNSLVVIVPNAVVRNELQFKKPQILKRARAVNGGQVIRAIIFRAG